MMSDDNFWPCLDEMVKLLTGSREESENTLDRFEMEARLPPKFKREELRNDLMIVVGQLARLATRINEMNG
jgi:hypothetical protein